MTRTIGNCPVRPTVRTARNGWETRSYTVKVVTPMFGGGVEPGVADPVTPIRVPSIRGHLRFWWRATRGAGMSIEELRKREIEIWGDTENPSKVQVAARVLENGQPKPCATLPAGKNFPQFESEHPAYALFPFQGDAKKNIPIRNGIHGIEFELILHYPASLSADVRTAAWAWLNFGGIGARTRRGCGALYCKDVAPPLLSRDDLWKWLSEGLQDVRLWDSPSAWPLFSKRLLFSEEAYNPVEAWNRGIDLLKRFRQGEGIGRNSGQGNRPGRSRWPEPEAIRKLTSRRFAKHQRLEAIPDRYFPRAEFGLPILFHFKDKKTGDPQDTTLVPVEGGERMSSPLIIRPLMCGDGKAVAMIFLLNTPLPYRAKIEGREVEVRSTVLAGYRDSPMKNRSPSGSALEAFLAFARERGFQEVTL